MGWLGTGFGVKGQHLYSNTHAHSAKHVTWPLGHKIRLRLTVRCPDFNSFEPINDVLIFESCSSFRQDVLTFESCLSFRLHIRPILGNSRFGVTSLLNLGKKKIFVSWFVCECDLRKKNNDEDMKTIGGCHDERLWRFFWKYLALVWKPQTKPPPLFRSRVLMSRLIYVNMYVCIIRI